jgi:hypothetical protein
MYITRNMNINKQRQYNIKQKNTTQHRIESFNLLLKVDAQCLLDHRCLNIQHITTATKEIYTRLMGLID